MPSVYERAERRNCSVRRTEIDEFHAATVFTSPPKNGSGRERKRSTQTGQTGQAEPALFRHGFGRHPNDFAVGIMG